MTLDPHARKLLDILAAAGAPDIAAMTPADMRARFARFMQLVGARGPAVGRIEDRTLPGAAGPLAIRIYTPQGTDDAALPGLIYFHGGGGVFGSLETHDGLCRALANASGCRLLAVDYRLAPEHPFPAAADDAWAAVRWVFDNADALGLVPDRIAVGGDSAGGGLAAAVCQRAADAGGPQIAQQLLLCPALDMAEESDSRIAFADGYFLDRATIAWMLAHYRPRDLDPADPRLSPLRAADLSGQPPAQIHTAAFDPLCSEGRAYADRLAAAGVAVRYTCHPGMIHHFYAMTAAIPYAASALADIGLALKQSLAAPLTPTPSAIPPRPARS